MNTQLQAVAALKTLRGFIGPAQVEVVRGAMRGEEKQFFFDKMVELATVVSSMPKTYEQDGKGGAAVASLHYFVGGCDWYILEKDIDSDGEGQVQAFGFANLGYGGELGYISIPEILANGGELDFYWTPKTMSEIRKSS